MRSAWARSFKKGDKCGFEQALALACTPDLPVDLCWNADTGELRCAIVPVSAPGFWMDAPFTLEKAMALCKRMGWVVRNQNTRESVVSYMRSAYGISEYDKTGMPVVVS